MVIDFIIAFMLLIYSIRSFVKGVTTTHDKNSYSSWETRFHYFTNAVWALGLSLLFFFEKIHIADFFD